MRTPLTNVGLAAYIVEVEGVFTVWVKADNGYFTVSAPFEDLALHLGRVAARRADDPADTPPITSPPTAPPTSVETTSVTTTTAP